MLPLVFLLSPLACGDDDEVGDGTTGTGDSACDDPDYNPFAGTCVETFLADCFDPVGECDGTVDTTSGDTVLTWANGASVETSVDYSDPTAPGAAITLTGSDGNVCATGVSKTNFGGCASQTVYTRTSDGAEQIWCVQTDGSLEVVCPGGEGIAVTAAESQAANDCAYGSDAEPCDISY